MSKYSDKIVAEMREIASFTYDSAKVFAEANDLTLRSVIAKIRALELDYQPKDPKISKNRSAPAKADIVSSIERNLQRELASLIKMTVADLLMLDADLKTRVIA